MIDEEDAKVFISPTFNIYYPVLWEGNICSFCSPKKKMCLAILTTVIKISFCGKFCKQPVTTKKALCYKQVPAVRSGQKIWTSPRLSCCFSCVSCMPAQLNCSQGLESACKAWITPFRCLKRLNYCCTRRIHDMLNSLFNSPDSKMWKMSGCLYVATPLHDINFHPTNADNQSLTTSCFLFQYCIIINLGLSLTFLWAEPESISKGISSVHAALIWHIIQRPQWLQQNATPSFCFPHPVQTTLPHCWDPLPFQRNNMACKMGLKERKNGSGEVHSG